MDATGPRDDTPRSVLDSRDLTRFLARLSAGSRWGCQVYGASSSDGGFSSIRIRIRDDETGQWHVREFRAEHDDGVPRIAYYAAEYDSDEAETAARQAYGVSIRENIEERTGRAVSIGAIYTTLGRLEERGLVRSRTEEPRGRTGRPRNYYRLSRDGARDLRESYDTIQSMAGGVTSELDRLAES